MYNLGKYPYTPSGRFQGEGDRFQKSTLAKESKNQNETEMDSAEAGKGFKSKPLGNFMLPLSS